ncbi:MAG TPA: alpha-amylase family glycosyl hydrolase [Rectinemataceae bacterium]|nr:alpha-amylase family glycosyl hydrolase [Rectinemataceae bacterium]
MKERNVLTIRLETLEGSPAMDGAEGRSDASRSDEPAALAGDRVMEFHISRKARREFDFDASLFKSTGNVIIPDFREARLLARRINERVGASVLPEKAVKAGKLNAMALIDEILHDIARLYREKISVEAFASCLATLERELGSDVIDGLLYAFVEDFPPLAVHRGELDVGEWLAAKTATEPTLITNRELALEEFILLRLANENPAFGPFRFLFDDGSMLGADERNKATGLAAQPGYDGAIALIEAHFASLPSFGPDEEDLVTMMRAPMRAAPWSLAGQLDFIRRKWGLIIGDKLLRLLGGLDLMKEEERPFFPGPGPSRTLVYSGMEKEYERFSADRDWMPNVVMIAKTTLVWLDQLSRRYGRHIKTLDAIPGEEFDLLASRGINALWLIGLWERSEASARIKVLCGNPEAAASAYSLFDYEIAGEFGGWPALEAMREEAGRRGIRLAADMVPNHTGIDSAWVRERPELFMRRNDCPYPGYSFNGENLSRDGRFGIWLEDHYYDRRDAAVVFKRVDFGSGRCDYIYHGNDGTGLPWSDTAQLDFLNPATREAVKERILHVARNFPIIRFDAAMVLAKRSFRRLWYPEPGQGGAVPSRAEFALSQEAFEAAVPEEFWRELVDLCARETPDTLLLAEAFWMMEGYFVRTLGMHRVYNSAFMNMLKKEENAKYRETIRNTQEFDRDILKRFVNFMNNPDEETAIAQFGSGDKYFGVCTMMATMPGLPMFGHGQIEGFTEKYGMEYRRAYKDESPDEALLARHEREIFPLLRRRHLFSGVEDFLLFDFAELGGVNENVFVYTNRAGAERSLVAYNNAYARADGRVRESTPFAVKTGEGNKRLEKRGIAWALGLHAVDGHYLALREQRSGLWFLRRSREIAETGLHLMLEGFQSQVFLDIFEAIDDKRGLWSQLHDELGGRGVPDLSEALEDIARKDLYGILARFFTPTFLSSLRSLVEPEAEEALGDSSDAIHYPLGPGAEDKDSGGAGKAGTSARSTARTPGGLSPEAEAAVLDFYSAVRGLMRQEAMEEGLGPEEGGDGERAKTADRSAARKARDGFLAGLEALVLFASEDGEPDGLVHDWLDREGGIESAAAFLVLEALAELSPGLEKERAARRLAEKLALGRKLREAIQLSGVSGHEAWHGMSLALLFAGSPAWDEPSASGLLPLLASLDRDDELRNFLGVNVWDGTTWFKREAFDAFLCFASVANLVRGGAPLDRVAVLKAEIATARGAEVASAYRLEGFLAAMNLVLAAHEHGRRPEKRKAAKPASAGAQRATRAVAAAPEGGGRRKPAAKPGKGRDSE